MRGSRFNSSPQEIVQWRLCYVLLDTYYGLVLYGFYDIFYSGLVILLGTGSVFYKSDNFWNIDYGSQHGYVMELCIVLMDCDKFSFRRYDCFGMVVFLMNCDSSRNTWLRSTHQKQLMDFLFLLKDSVLA